MSENLACRAWSLHRKRISGAEYQKQKNAEEQEVDTSLQDARPPTSKCDHGGRQRQQQEREIASVDAKGDRSMCDDANREHRRDR